MLKGKQRAYLRSVANTLKPITQIGKEGVTESFFEAFVKFSVTQPALSKAISKLEEELKVSLFEKKGRNIKLTEYGEVFLTYSNKALIEIENGIKTIGNMLTEKNHLL